MISQRTFRVLGWIGAGAVGLAGLLVLSFWLTNVASTLVYDALFNEQCLAQINTEKYPDCVEQALQSRLKSLFPD